MADVSEDELVSSGGFTYRLRHVNNTIQGSIGYSAAAESERAVFSIANEVWNSMT